MIICNFNYYDSSPVPFMTVIKFMSYSLKSILIFKLKADVGRGRKVRHERG
jgi:hypothetical protein